MSTVSAMVSGSTVFSDPLSEASGAVIHILVEEVTRSDAPATTVTQLELTIPAFGAGHHPLPFSLQIDSLDPAKRYALRVHVDVDGDGRISSGDHVSVESYPVVTQGAPNEVQVRVRRI